MLTENKFGFRSGRETEHAIHRFVKFMHSPFDGKKIGLGVFLDVKKAFDPLDRNILLDKLLYYGITGAAWNWFQSYLVNRRQLTVYNECGSSVQTLDFGVPPFIYI